MITLRCESASSGTLQDGRVGKKECVFYLSTFVTQLVSASFMLRSLVQQLFLYENDARVEGAV
jgi:hypothetical protein